MAHSLESPYEGPWNAMMATVEATHVHWQRVRAPVPVCPARWLLLRLLAKPLPGRHHRCTTTTTETRPASEHFYHSNWSTAELDLKKNFARMLLETTLGALMSLQKLGDRVLRWAATCQELGACLGTRQQDKRERDRTGPRKRAGSEWGVSLSESPCPLPDHRACCCLHTPVWLGLSERPTLLEQPV